MLKNLKLHFVNHVDALKIFIDKAFVKQKSQTFAGFELANISICCKKNIYIFLGGNKIEILKNHLRLWVNVIAVFHYFWHRIYSVLIS